MPTGAETGRGIEVLSRPGPATPEASSLPDPFEQVIQNTTGEIQTIFSRVQERQLSYFYELPLSTVSRRDFLTTAIESLVDKWGEQDKKRNGIGYVLFRNSNPNKLVARVEPKKGIVQIPLWGGQEDAMEKIRTIIALLAYDFVAAEIAEETENYFSARNALQARKEDHKTALEASQPGFRPRALRIFIV